MTREELVEINKRACALLTRIALGPADVIRQALEPSAQDYEAVFVGGAAHQAAEGYASFWREPPAALAQPANMQIRVVTLLAEDIADSREFPNGYRKIAHLLAPGHVWCRFKFVAGGGTDVIAYDGLVARGERWAWFPKPWRVLAQAN